MDLSQLFLLLGALFLAGLVADQVGRRSRLPRVTLLIGCGVLAGPSVTGLLPALDAAWVEFLSVAALTMVAFLLGGSLTRDKLLKNGRTILSVSLCVVAGTVIVMSGGLMLLGVAPPVALILAAIATATDPAATQDVIRQGGFSGNFADTIKGIVAIDDAWGLLVFSVILVLAGVLTGAGGEGLILQALHELAVSLGLGIAIGGVGSVLTSRLQPGEPIQSEALGLVFLCAGLALWLDGSYLVAGMTAGTVMANLSRHPGRAFQEIRHMQWPFMMLFFILAGASLNLADLESMGGIGIAFLVLRVLSRQVGAWAGARLVGAPAQERALYGIALLPQAGVAVGMALIAARDFPEMAHLVLTVTIAATIVFEIVGPVGTYYALRKAEPDAAPESSDREFSENE